MDFQEVKTFIAVAQAESFSWAADRLGYSQAAVTIRIKKLEEELGVRLFDRLGKYISLTDRGEVFYNQMVPLVNQMEDICTNIRPEAVPGGHIQIGTIDSMANTIMLDVIKRMRKDYPKVKISVTIDTPERLYEMLKKNQLDIIYLIDEKVQEKWAKTLFCEKETVVMIADANHPLANQKNHALEEIAEYPIMLTEENASYRKILDEGFRRKGLHVQPVFETDNIELLLGVLRGSGAMTYLPEYTVRKHLKEKRFQKIKLKGLEEQIFRQVIVHKDKWIHAEMRVFLNCIC